jgi:addiction module HigA family antidote
MARKHRSILPMHPGELLREDVLPALGITQTVAAKYLGISRQSLHEILTEKRAVTPEMAVRLGKLCGNGPTLWANLQSKYDVWKAEEMLDVRGIPTLEARA